MMKQTKKAFTLVELIIVITILAILATIGFMSFQSYTADARNSKRTNDLASVESKLVVSLAKTPANALTYASGVTDNQVTATLTVGSGTALTLNTNYQAGNIHYTNLNISSDDFSDPASTTTAPVPYKIGITNTTKKGMLYQLAAKLESNSEDAQQSLVRWLFLTGGTDAALWLIAGSWSTSNSGLVNKSTDVPY